jgi:alkylated DNA repair protein alkB family protein 8
LKKERRIKGIIELSRIIKPGGKALITVWAKEQKYKEKESYYIASKGQKKATSNQQESSSIKERKKRIEDKPDETRVVQEKNKDTVVHTYGKEFEKSDLFVAWRLNPKVAKNKTEEEIDQKNESNSLFLRYYHVFVQNELEAMFEFVPGVRIVESFYEQGNWCVIFQKETS